MKEKILALLKTKFIGVPDVILERIATKKAETTTTEEQATTLIEGLTLQNVLDSYGDFRATEATQSAVSNYEKKHGIKDGKLVQTEESKGKEQGAGIEMEGLPESVRKIFEVQSRQIAELTKTVQGAVSTVSTSKKQADAKQLFTNAKLPEKWIERLDLESETPIQDQIKGLQDEYSEIRQGIVNDAVAGGNYVPPVQGKERSEKEWADLMNGDGDGKSNAGVVSLGTED